MRIKGQFEVMESCNGMTYYIDGVVGSIRLAASAWQRIQSAIRKQGRVMITGGRDNGLWLIIEEASGE